MCPSGPPPPVWPGAPATPPQTAPPLQGDDKTLVKDTTAWTLGRIADLHAEVIVAKYLQPVLQAMVKALGEAPGVADTSQRRAGGGMRGRVGGRGVVNTAKEKAVAVCSSQWRGSKARQKPCPDTGPETVRKRRPLSKKRARSEPRPQGGEPRCIRGR